MPVPKYRTSASKRNMRRSHHALKSVGLSECPNCQEVKRPHMACPACGHYNGRQVMEVEQFNTNTENSTESGTPENT